MPATEMSTKPKKRTPRDKAREKWMKTKAGVRCWFPKDFMLLSELIRQEEIFNAGYAAGQKKGKK